MWVLIISMYASAFSDNDFAALTTHEFSSQETCEVAKKEFTKNFDTLRSTSTQAICVKK